MGEHKPAPSDGGVSNDQEASIRMVANAIHRLNEAVMKAVDSGVTVETMRASRYHNEEGNWGDQLVPIIRTGD